MANRRQSPDHPQRSRERPGRKRPLPAPKRNRLGRTILLGTLAVTFALVWLARELELDRDELLGYLGTSAMFVVVLIGFSILGAAAIWVLKRLRRR